MTFEEFKTKLIKELVFYGVGVPSDSELSSVWVIFSDNDDLLVIGYGIACDLYNGFSLDDAIAAEIRSL